MAWQLWGYAPWTHNVMGGSSLDWSALLKIAEVMELELDRYDIYLLRCLEQAELVDRAAWDKRNAG